MSPSTSDIGVRVYKLPPTEKFTGLDRDGRSLRGVFALEAMTRADPASDPDPESGQRGLRALGTIPLRGRFPDFGGGFFPTAVGFMRIQGGAVSQNDHLWLTSWSDDTVPTQLNGIDLLTGQLRSQARIQNSWTQEIEGITALDLGDAGQLHVVLIDNLGTSSLYFKHYEAERPEERTFV